jgi:micrococcal nuclease
VTPNQLLAGLSLAMAALSTPAAADTCEAIPESGPTPAFLSIGASFTGPVVEVIDGDSLCVAVGPRAGLDWVEVRLADFYAPEFSSPTGPAAKAALQRIAGGQQATCVASMRTYDRIAARCRIGGQAIGDLLRTAGVLEGGNGSGYVSPPAARPAQAARAPVPAGLTCAEIRARGGARRGEPGYRQEWDGDNDGIACEPYRGR